MKPINRFSTILFILIVTFTSCKKEADEGSGQSGQAGSNTSYVKINGVKAFDISVANVIVVHKWETDETGRFMEFFLFEKESDYQIFLNGGGMTNGAFINLISDKNNVGVLEGIYENPAAWSDPSDARTAPDYSTGFADLRNHYYEWFDTDTKFFQCKIVKTGSDTYDLESSFKMKDDSGTLVDVEIVYNGKVQISP